MLLANVPKRLGLNALVDEHNLLAATFNDAGAVTRYARETSSHIRLDSHTVLADLSRMQTLVFSGPAAESFASATFAGNQPAVGECATQAVLTGDGAVVSCPLLIRTGIQEYVVCDASSRAEVLSGWLSFVAALEQDGFAPYADLELDDATGTHCTLLLAGHDSAHVLGDYLQSGISLPVAGSVNSCTLDTFPCVVAHPNLGETTGYVVFAPPSCAVPLWRSFLSFTEVTPVGLETLRSLSRDLSGWSKQLDSTDTIRIDKSTLATHGLVRNTNDFIGARGLE